MDTPLAGSAVIGAAAGRRCRARGPACLDPAGVREDGWRTPSGITCQEAAMAVCEVCGNDYALSFEVTAQGSSHTFDCFECAIQRLAPVCEHCSCRIIGHGVGVDGHFYCCAHCARQSGADKRASSPTPWAALRSSSTAPVRCAMSKCRDGTSHAAVAGSLLPDASRRAGLSAHHAGRRGASPPAGPDRDPVRNGRPRREARARLIVRRGRPAAPVGAAAAWHG